MRSNIFAPVLSFSLVLLAACGGDPPPPAPEPAPAAPAPAPEPPPAPPAPAPVADGAPMTVDGLNAAREANVGKVVSVKGAYGNVTKQDAPKQINVSVHLDDKLEGEAKQVLCIVDPAKEAELSAFTQKAAVVVTGTVAKDDFFGGAKLEGCTVAADAGAPAPAPAEEAAEGGKAGKGKGKGKGGDEGEGGKAGKGKGKGGKGKGE